MRKLSIVIPIFNEEENIAHLHSRLLDVIKKLKYFNNYEIILVNDGSRDKSLQKMSELAKTNHRVKVVSLSRNFGQEIATVAGIEHASGEAVTIIDADLQDPPELFLSFEQALEDGYDIAYGQRLKRLNESFLKKLTSKLFYPIFRWLTKLDIPRNASAFCMMSRKATNDFRKLKEHSPFMRGMIYWSGLPKKAVPFVRPKRVAGKTKYNYCKMSRYALDGILSFSIEPLYLITYTAGFATAICAIVGVTTTIMKLAGLVTISGWTALITAMLFLSSITIFIMGIIGLYIGKIFEEIKGRPRYVVGKLVNFDTEKINVRNSGIHKSF